MYEILCFGDSNTWGWIPGSGERYPFEKRWTGVLQKELGKGFHIIEEGLNGRTTLLDDPIEFNRNGLKYLVPCLESHKPLDLVVLLLGSNDLKARFSVTAFDIALSVGVLIDVIKRSESGRGNRAPEVLLLAPPPLGDLTDFAELFEGGREKSQKLGNYYRSIAEERESYFLDLGDIVSPSDIDGVHFSEESHRIVGKKVAETIGKIIL